MIEQQQETFAEGMAKTYRGIRHIFNQHRCATTASEEVRQRVNSDFDRVIEHWEKQDKTDGA